MPKNVSATRVTRLVKKAQRGNTQAFQELYELQFNRAYFMALKMLGNSHEALEVTQEVFEYVYKNLSKLRDPVAFPKWFGLIIHSKCIDAIRGKTRISEYEIDDANEGAEDAFVEHNEEFLPEACLDTEESRQLISQLVQELPIAQRESIMMYYFEDLSGEEIAEITGSKVDAVYRRLSDARRTLRIRLSQTEGFEVTAGTGAAAAVPVLTRVLQQEAAAQVAAVHTQQQGILGNLALQPMATTAKSAAAAKGVSVPVLAKGAGAVAAAVMMAGAGAALYQGNAKDVSPVSAPVVAAPSQTAPIPRVIETTIEETQTAPAPKPPKSAPKTTKKTTTKKTVKKAPETPPARPEISLGLSELYYPLGETVALSTILADANPQAFDAQGKKLRLTTSGYDSIDFTSEGYYLISLSAQDSAGVKANTEILTIVIQE